MILTVTLNPSLDYHITVGGLTPWRTMRTLSESLTAGGKGINVSLVLTALGVENTALGFAAGFTGDELLRLLSREGLSTRFRRLAEGSTRINVKITDAEGTEINGTGPAVTDDDLAWLAEQLDALAPHDTLVLSGSLPAGMDVTAYARLAAPAAARGVRVVVDTSGEALLETLPCRPFLIKPNRDELPLLIPGVRIPAYLRGRMLREAVAPYARRLCSMGARNVLVSLGGEGALLATENGMVFASEAPRGNAVNSVGAGDAMIAGFIAGAGAYAQRDAGTALSAPLLPGPSVALSGTVNEPLSADACRGSLRLAVAAGSACAFRERFASGDEIRALCESMPMPEQLA